MHITHHLIKKYKKNSIKVARELGHKNEILDYLDSHTKFILRHEKAPKGVSYGAHISDKKHGKMVGHPKIEIYKENLSCESIPTIIKELSSMNVSEKNLEIMEKILRRIPKRFIFHVFNQSGMDHELIGHVYNRFARKKHDEKAAYKVQVEFAKARGGKLWHDFCRLFILLRGS